MDSKCVLLFEVNPLLINELHVYLTVALASAQLIRRLPSGPIVFKHLSQKKTS